MGAGVVHRMEDKTDSIFSSGGRFQGNSGFQLPGLCFARGFISVGMVGVFQANDGSDAQIVKVMDAGFSFIGLVGELAWRCRWGAQVPDGRSASEDIDASIDQPE